MPRRRRRWSPQEKADIVRRFVESGLTRQAFAASVGIHASLLAKWIRLAADGELPDPTPVLLPVRVTPRRPTRAALLEIELKNERTARVFLDL